MRKVFVALALVAIIVSATMLPEVKQRAQNSFAKLHKSRVGKNIITAIQLELSSKNQENIVVRILTLLNELLEEQTTQLHNTEDELAAKTDYCNTTRESYEGQIASKKADISAAQASLPVLHAELDAAVNNKADQESKLDRAQLDLTSQHEINAAAVAAYEKSQRNHNNMIEALKQARALIVQLQASSFLQKNNAVLAQIQSHRETATKSLESHPGKTLFSLLMQMAQDVGIQADQQLVGSVIEVIDDLLKHEQDSADAETQGENERVAAYDQRVQELEGEIRAAQEEIARLEGEITRLGNEIADTENNINTWSGQLAELEALLEGHNAQCDIEIHHLNDVITELHDDIDTIRQVIAIFEGQSIQDIKPVVEDLSYE